MRGLLVGADATADVQICLPRIKRELSRVERSSGDLEEAEAGSAQAELVVRWEKGDNVLEDLDRQIGHCRKDDVAFLDRVGLGVVSLLDGSKDKRRTKKSQQRTIFECGLPE